jgi:hypothetical protein
MCLTSTVDILQEQEKDNEENSKREKFNFARLDLSMDL